MSRIAQQLCDEIVEPALKLTKDSPTKKSPSRIVSQCPTKPISKTTRSIVVEKRKVINKLVTNGSNASRTKFKSKEILLKKLKDTGVNTLMTGQLRCDNDCVTMVRKRDNKCACKCGQKRLNYNGSTKQIQTFDSRNFLATDKACAHFIETANCGTQLNILSGNIKPVSITGNNQSNKNIMKIQSNNMEGSNRFGQQSSTSSRPYLNFMGARRWALSQYQTHGPDF